MLIYFNLSSRDGGRFKIRFGFNFISTVNRTGQHLHGLLGYNSMVEKSSFALIVPCYNEQEAIPDFLQELEIFNKSFSSALPDIDLTVVVVDNNSSDSS